MIKLYRILTIIVNMILTAAIILSAYEIISGEYPDPKFTLKISALALYVVITSTYFLLKTWKVKVNHPWNYSLDADLIDIEETKDFPYSLVSGISNMITGLFIVGATIYVFFTAPLSLKGYLEIFRSVFLILLLFYGILSIYYPLQTLRKLKS